MSRGQQGVSPGAQLLLLPLPVRGVQPVGAARHVPRVGHEAHGRRPTLLPAGGQTGPPPLHRAAVGPPDGSADAGHAAGRSRHHGGGDGDDGAGETRGAGPIHHQGDRVRVPVRLLGGGRGGGGGGGGGGVGGGGG